MKYFVRSYHLKNTCSNNDITVLDLRQIINVSVIKSKPHKFIYLRIFVQLLTTRENNILSFVLFSSYIL